MQKVLNLFSVHILQFAFCILQFAFFSGLFGIFTLSILPSACYSQDRPATKPQLLPFQTPAPTQTSDEQLAIQFYQARDFEKAAEIY